MKNKLLYALLVFFSVLALVSCRNKTETPVVTPTPTNPITETPVNPGYSVGFLTFNIGDTPATLEKVTHIPSDLPVLNVKGYEFGGWYYDINFTQPVNVGDEDVSTVFTYPINFFLFFKYRFII